MRVQLMDDGRPVAAAVLRRTDQPEVRRADLHLEAGKLPVGIRDRLVDAVLDHPVVCDAARLEATVPAGDGEILDRFRVRCGGVRVRAAGTTCLVDAELPPLHPRLAQITGPARFPSSWDPLR